MKSKSNIRRELDNVLKQIMTPRVIRDRFQQQFHYNENFTKYPLEYSLIQEAHKLVSISISNILNLNYFISHFSVSELSDYTFSVSSFNSIILDIAQLEVEDKNLGERILNNNYYFRNIIYRITEMIEGLNNFHIIFNAESNVMEQYAFSPLRNLLLDIELKLQPKLRKMAITENDRIFICATKFDLMEERCGIISLLQKMKIPYNTMEDFGAKVTIPIETCLNELRSSQLIIVIIGHKYGTYVPEWTPQISFSHAEYNEAARLKIPILAYFKSEESPVLPAFYESDPDKLTKLKIWKKELLKLHTVGYFNDANDLAQQIAADLRNVNTKLEEGSIKAIMQVKLKPEQSELFINTIKKFTNISPPRLVLGRYDLIIEVNDTSFKNISDTIFTIRNIEGVIDSHTNFVILSDDIVNRT